MHRISNMRLSFNKGRVPNTIYYTRWKEAGGELWNSGLNLELGFYMDSQQIPQPIVMLNNEDISSYLRITVDKNRCLLINIDLIEIEPIVEGKGLYIICMANLSVDGKSFDGVIKQVGSNIVNYIWQGNIKGYM